MLQLPPLLGELLAVGRWPRNGDESIRQNLHPLVSGERVKVLAPEEDWLYLYPPPFRTIRELCSRHECFWTDSMAAPEGIDFDLAVLIGDFGLGSDAPILLDYRGRLENPRVLRLKWAPPRPSGNRWVEMSPDFPSFVEALGL